MSAVHGKDVRVLVNGVHVSGQISSYQMTTRRQLADVTNALSTGEQWLPGQVAGAIALKGPLDTAIGLDAVVSAAAGTDDSLQVAIAPGGLVVGQDAFAAVADPSGLVVDATVKAAVQLAVDATPDDGVDWGSVLHGLTAETADGDGTTVDELAATSAGGAAYLHVTAYSGLTDATVYVEDSPDGSTWATLATFTAVTAVGQERVTYTGAVDRYVRARWDVTGTGSITFVVVACRR